MFDLWVSTSYISILLYLSYASNDDILIMLTVGEIAPSGDYRHLSCINWLFSCDLLALITCNYATWIDRNGKNCSIYCHGSVALLS